jgi:hypothetical protein
MRRTSEPPRESTNCKQTWDCVIGRRTERTLVGEGEREGVVDLCDNGLDCAVWGGVSRSGGERVGGEKGVQG